MMAYMLSMSLPNMEHPQASYSKVAIPFCRHMMGWARFNPMAKCRKTCGLLNDTCRADGMLDGALVSSGVLMRWMRLKS
jgi:hypothetical protein